MLEATFVIIGGGISGVTCAKSINFLSPEAKIILITSNSLIKQVKTIIPLGKVSMQLKISETNSDNLSEDNSSLKIINDTVIKINSSEKIIYTENEIIIKYTKLCICTGARPKLISQDNPYVIGIRDTESVEDFSSRLSKSRRIIVVGNGGIASEIVYKIDNIEIIWVIKDKYISATFVDPGAAEFFKSRVSEDKDKSGNESLKSTLSADKDKTGNEFSKSRLSEDENKSGNESLKLKLSEDKDKSGNVGLCKRIRYSVEKIKDDKSNITGPSLGPDWKEIFESGGTLNQDKKITIEYECEVSRILDSGDVAGADYPVYAELSNGKIIGCDFIVSATGVTPNSEIMGLENIDKSEDGGILVDWKLESSIEGIYAAGDVATANWKLSDHWFQMKLWTQAYQMGCYVGKSMVSALNNEYFLQDFSFEIFTHVTEFFGFKIVLLGLFNGQKLDNYEILLRMTKDLEYVKLVVKGGKLQGAVLIGDTDLEEMCENLILNQLDISVYGEDLLNPDIDIEDYFD